MNHATAPTAVVTGFSATDSRTLWNRGEQSSVVIFKTAEAYGELSNMHNGFPFELGTLRIRSTEALYQAMRFPHRPDWQKEILDAPHAMMAKMMAKKEGRRSGHSRCDWTEVQEDLMWWCLNLKLQAWPDKFGLVLLRTANREIVERSHRDSYWGAVPTKDGALAGNNRLGVLLMKLRCCFAQWLAESDDAAEFPVSVPRLPEMLLLGRPIEHWLCG